MIDKNKGNIQPSLNHHMSLSRFTSMDLRESSDRLPVMTSRGLRQGPNSRTFYVLTTQEGARDKSLTTDLQGPRDLTPIERQETSIGQIADLRLTTENRAAVQRFLRFEFEKRENELKNWEEIKIREENTIRIM